MIRRPRHFFPLVLALAILLATLEAAGVALRARFDPVGRGACWIWAPGVHNEQQPVAFQAVRDFELGDSWDGESAPARLTLIADESYILYVNGRWIGSGVYREEAGADLYDLTAELEMGGNRLVVELSSGRGAGGLLASLRVGDRLVVATDEQWRIHRRYDAGILRGWDLPEGESARIWQRHPTGRWGLASASPRPVSPIELRRPTSLSAKSLYLPWDPDAWPDFETSKISFSDELGPWVLLDWGREVTGFLRLQLASRDAEPGLLHVSGQIPDRDAPADALVIPIPGRDEWTDSVPRTFRYLLLTDVPLSGVPEVLVAPAASLGHSEAPSAGSAGVFGITPPLERSLAEERIRERQRLSMSDDS